MMWDITVTRLVPPPTDAGAAREPLYAPINEARVGYLQLQENK